MQFGLTCKTLHRKRLWHPLKVTRLLLRADTSPLPQLAIRTRWPVHYNLEAMTCSDRTTLGPKLLTNKTYCSLSRGAQNYRSQLGRFLSGKIIRQYFVLPQEVPFRPQIPNPLQRSLRLVLATPGNSGPVTPPFFPHAPIYRLPRAHCVSRIDLIAPVSLPP